MPSVPSFHLPVAPANQLNPARTGQKEDRRKREERKRESDLLSTFTLPHTCPLSQHIDLGLGTTLTSLLLLLLVLLILQLNSYSRSLCLLPLHLLLPSLLGSSFLLFFFSFFFFFFPVQSSSARARQEESPSCRLDALPLFCLLWHPLLLAPRAWRRPFSTLILVLPLPRLSFCCCCFLLLLLLLRPFHQPVVRL